MKHKILLVLFLSFMTCFTVSAQKVTMQFRQVKLAKVFDAITQQTGLTVAYSRPTVNPDRIVTIEAKDEELSNVLNKLFTGTNVAFEIGEKKIYLKEKAALDATQPKKNLKTISGIIVDEKGESVIGASVVVKGTSIGTITDVDGHYSLSNVPSNSIVSISYIGYKSLELKANDKALARITLKEDNEMLDEVVVVGYGTIKKANLSGAVGQISSKEIEHRISGNTGQTLQGLIPNLNVSFSDGAINKKASFDVRGVGSINGGSPLVLIDGVEGDLNYVNPKDIASVSVLKDASSAAIYGARAAFGVVLISTKDPEKGAVQVNYSNHFGWSNPTISTDNFITDGLEWARLSDKLSLMENTSTYLGYTEEDYAYMEARKKDPSLPAVLIKTVDGVERYVHYGNTDWWGYIFRKNQPSMEHNINLSGGTDKMRFYLSGRYYSREGIYRINPDKFKSYTLRSKVDFQILSNLRLSNTTNIFISDYDYPATNTRSVDGNNNSENWRKYTYHASPLFLPHNPDGTIMINSAYAPGRDIADGTFADLIYGKSRGTDSEYDVMNTVSLQFNPIKGLDLNADYSFRKEGPFSRQLIVATPHTNQPGGEGLTLYKTNSEMYKERHWHSMYQAINAYATYSHTFNDRHNLKAMLGFNQEWKHWERTTAKRSGPISEDLGSFSLATGDNIELLGAKEEWAIRAAFYRLNYDYKGKYLVEFNGRFDLSSKFPHDNRLGIFPSGSLAWRVSEENFFKGLRSTITNFKLRASYGTLGNQNVGPYDYITKMKAKQGGYIVNGSYLNYLNTPDAISTNFTWEKSETFNLGFDLSFFDGHLSTSFDWYQRNTRDMLTQGKELPAVFGTSEPEENAADLRTRGFELSVNWHDKFILANRPFEYRIGASLADNRTVITKFDNPSGLIDEFYVGKELGEIWGYTIDGFFQSDDEYLSHADQLKVNYTIRNKYFINHPVAGDLKFKDLNDDDEISPGKKTLEDHGDLRIIGNSSPRYTLGLNLNMTYAGFDLSAFFQGVMKQDWWPGKENSYFWGPYVRPYENFFPKSIESMSWTPDNQDAYFPRLAADASNQGSAYEGGQLSVHSDKYLQNAAYVRLKNITIGYTLPAQVCRKIKFLKSVRFYVSGENILTFSPLYKHNPDHTVDPEQLGDGNSYPFSKTFAFGFDIKF
ncbi:TonB-dependent receptor [Bacteroides stercorirosoris]|uniref:TonB-linked outer membrane protein, SusC/RagA family n=2 Tax=Bacteroides stercorirosoris TaxID=871324 RepID=A0A1M6HS11_9BACE|nr:TonB-dependent receptor [Bacteroides stercorirosoris]SHJ24914.1 TonB-linked outer membrane protein, SusC/RagA family [Bacteroides stercorirosoris]